MSLNNTIQIIKKYFTDCSKSFISVSAEAVFLNSKLSFSTNLSAMSSIFAEETVAIRITLFNIHRTVRTTSPTFSSLIVIKLYQQLLKKNSNNPIILDILLKYIDLNNHNYNKKNFCWIPSHVGIKATQKQ